MSSIWDVTSEALSVGIQGTELRQQALADNIANIDTPGYKRQDVSFQSALQSALNSDDPASQVEAVQPTTYTDGSGEVGVNGNNVSLEQEMTDISSNELLGAALTNTMTARMAIFKTAVTDGRE